MYDNQDTCVENQVYLLANRLYHTADEYEFPIYLYIYIYISSIKQSQSLWITTFTTPPEIACTIVWKYDYIENGGNIYN